MLRHALPAAAVALVGASACGLLRVNLSESVPIGLYAVHPGTAPRRGMLAVACLPEGLGREAMAGGYLGRGDCPGGAEPVLKPVAAAAGDTVDVTAAGVLVNGVPAVPPALARDSRGHAAASVPPGRYPVPQGAVWLLSAHSPRSWDSRYWGPVPESVVRGEAWPLLVLR